MFGNVDGSDEFNVFLNFIGDKVKLVDFKGYHGDLDTRFLFIIFFFFFYY
jgi:hypothetical protein